MFFEVTHRGVILGIGKNQKYASWQEDLRTPCIHLLKVKSFKSPFFQFQISAQLGRNGGIDGFRWTSATLDLDKVGKNVQEFGEPTIREWNLEKMVSGLHDFYQFRHSLLHQVLGLCIIFKSNTIVELYGTIAWLCIFRKAMLHHIFLV